MTGRCFAADARAILGFLAVRVFVNIHRPSWLVLLLDKLLKKLNFLDFALICLNLLNVVGKPFILFVCTWWADTAELVVKSPSSDRLQRFRWRRVDFNGGVRGWQPAGDRCARSDDWHRCRRLGQQRGDWQHRRQSSHTRADKPLTCKDRLASTGCRSWSFLLHHLCFRHDCHLPRFHRLHVTTHQALCTKGDSDVILTSFRRHVGGIIYCSSVRSWTLTYACKTALCLVRE